MPSAAFHAFRQRVLAEPSLQAALLAEADPARFPTVASELAEAIGFAVEPGEIVDQVKRAQLARTDTWAP